MGYIVLNKSCLNKIMALQGPEGAFAVKNAPKAGVLLHVMEDRLPKPTIFNTKKEAQSAITRTKRFFNKYHPSPFKTEYGILTEYEYAMLLESRSRRKKKSSQQ